MQTRIEQGKKASYHFDSLAELSRYIVDTPKTWPSSDSHNNYGAYREHSWALGATYPQAVEYARDGWLEGARQAQEALKAFTPNSPAPNLVNDFYGHVPHVPRFCAGAPDSMIRHAKENAKHGTGRVVTLYVPVNANSSTRAVAMKNLGLGVAQYVNQLETDGLRVEVYGVLCSDVRGWRVTHSWCIKRADQHLDLAVLAFSIGHPAMFRRLGFALRECCAAPYTSSYGVPMSCKLTDLINPPNGAYILNGMKDANTVASTPEKALTYIEQQINKALGIPDAD